MWDAVMGTSSLARTVAVLGVRRGRRPESALDLASSIERGLPVASLDKVAKAIAPADPDFRHRFVPRATLARRRRQQESRLTPAEGDRLARVARLWTHALSVWKSEDAAREFLFREHPMLGGRRPIDAALATEVGAELADQILGRLEFGSAA